MFDLGVAMLIGALGVCMGVVLMALFGTSL